MVQETHPTMRKTPGTGLEPARSIITILGGSAVAAQLCKRKRMQIWRWTQPKSAGGTDGLVPQKHHTIILAYARNHRLPITAESFLPIEGRGRSRRR